jgi:formylmethanofuran dehydrogenase subunit A
MPTVLFIFGWRLYFYANENKEPIHIHAEKAGMECKYWLLVDEMDIKEEYSYNMSPKDKREVRKIIFQNFDTIIDSWNNFFKQTI